MKSEPSRADEEELARRLVCGDARVLDDLVECYAARVMMLATRLLGWTGGADDIAQDVFLAVIEKPSAFRGHARLWTYLATITVNRCRTQRRRRWLHERVLQAVTFRANDQRASAPVIDEVAAQVRGAIEKLPPRYREVTILRYLDELSIAEVAEVLGLRRNTVEARLSRARKLLKPVLAKLADEE